MEDYIGSLEFLLQLLRGHVNDRHPVFGHEIKELMAVYAQEFGRFSLGNLTFHRI